MSTTRGLGAVMVGALALAACIGEAPTFDGSANLVADLPEIEIDATENDVADTREELRELPELPEVDPPDVAVEAETVVPCSAAGPLAGAWFVVLEDAAAGTARLDLALGQDGRLRATNVASNVSAWAAALSADDGSFCGAGTTNDGRVALELGVEVRAVPDAARTSMVLADDAHRAVGLALRKTGRTADVTGRYRVVKTEQRDPGAVSPITRLGIIPFAAGCIDGQGELTTTPGLGVALEVVATTGSCLTQVNDRLQLVVGMRISGRPQIFPETWVGAVGAGGDILVFVREEPGLVFPGTIILVREAAPPDLVGDWTFAQHRGGVSDPGAQPDVHYETGDLAFAAPAQLTSVVAGTQFGGWWRVDGAHVDLRATFAAAAPTYLSGYVTSGFIAGWVVAPPPIDPTAPQALDRTPREGSLFLAVRKAPDPAAPFAGRASF